MSEKEKIRDPSDPGNLETGVYNLSLNEKIREVLEADNFYKAISKNNEDIIKVLTKEGVIQFINPATEIISGYNEKELLGKNISTFIQPSLAKDNRKVQLILNKNGEYKKLKLKAIHKNGSPLYLESYCYFPLDIDNLDLHVLICKNVTQRILKEKQLVRSKIREEKASALFKKLNNISQNLISLWDLKKGTPIYYSNKFPLNYDFKTEAHILSSLEIIHPEDREKVKSHRLRVATIPHFEPPSLEFRARSKEGKWEWLFNRSSVLERDDAGLATLLLSSTTIISSFKNVQQQLLESTSRIAAFLANTKERIWSLNKEYVLTSFNNSFVEQYFVFCGYYPELGSSVFKNSSAEDVARWKPLYDRGFIGESFTELVVYDIEGEKLYYDCTIAPIKGPDGAVNEISCFVKNITEIKRSEQELQQLNFELDSFVYRASHDILAPLKSIQGLVSILKMDLDESEKVKYLSLIEKSVSKLETFIGSLTFFSRNSNMPLEKEAIDFEEIIKETLEGLAYMENAGRLNVTVNIEKPLDFLNDTFRIYIIFQNFISNAIKYQRLDIDDAKLEIDISKYENGVLLSLKDNGKGIAKEHLRKIFDMFFRASDETYGSGLGLYITKQTIEKIKGKILKVESELGQGTSFLIYIPGQ